MDEFIYKLTLDLNCAKTPPVICSGQFDKGRKFEFTITANGEPYDVTGCSAVLKGIRTDGSHFAVDCTVSDGKITKMLDDTTFSVRGKTVAKLVISDSEKSYSTQIFLIDVDSALDGDITVADDYSILNRLIEQIHALNESGAIIIDDTIDNESNNAVSNKAVATALNTKSDKATTLAGYGITDGIKYVATNSIDDCTDDKTLYRVHISDGSVLTGYHNLICINQTYYKSQYLFAQNGKIQFRVSAKNSDGDWGDWSDWRVLNDGAVTTKAIADKAITIAKLSDDLLEYIKSSSGTGNGKSAYDIAVDNGYTGTQAEWLTSLKGSDYVLTDDDKSEIADIVINELDNSLMLVLGGDSNATE